MHTRSLAHHGVGWAVARMDHRPGAVAGRQALGLVRACHVQPTLVVTGVATGLAVVSGRDAPGCLAVALTVLAGQLATGWSNDWFDAARDRAVGRIDKPIVAGLVSVATVRTAAVSAAAAAVLLSFLSGWRAALVAMVAGASALAYNLGLKATVISPLPYAVSFGLLPAFVTLGLPEHPWPRPTIMVATALLGVGAHFINTLADRNDDERSGIVGLPQRMTARMALVTGVTLLTLCAVAVWTLGGSGRGAESLLLAATLGASAMVVVSSLRSRPRGAWSWTLVTVVGCLAMFAVSRPPLVGG